MNKNTFHEDTVIELNKGIPLAKFRGFFEEATGKDLSDWEFRCWLDAQTGKTLKNALAAYDKASERENIKEILSEERFHIVSEADKAFIVAFDEEIGKFEYDFGGSIGGGICWGKYMVIYSKKGAKNKNIVARIYIRENDIVLRLFINNVDKHRAFIEKAPEHIKAVFTGDHGNCSCNPKKENCRARKTYAIDGRKIEKCSGIVFEFRNPTIAKLPDYVDLLAEFYPPKKSESIKNR